MRRTFFILFSTGRLEIDPSRPGASNKHLFLLTYFSYPDRPHARLPADESGERHACDWGDLQPKATHAAPCPARNAPAGGNVNPPFSTGREAMRNHLRFGAIALAFVSGIGVAAADPPGTEGNAQSGSVSPPSQL